MLDILAFQFAIFSSVKMIFIKLLLDKEMDDGGNRR